MSSTKLKSYLSSSKMSIFSERLQKMNISQLPDSNPKDAANEAYFNSFENYSHSSPIAQSHKSFHKSQISLESIETPKLLQTIHEYSEHLSDKAYNNITNNMQKVVIVSVRINSSVFGNNKNEITNQGKELLNFALDKLVLPGDKVIVITVVKNEEYFDNKYLNLEEEFNLMLQTWIELGFAKRISVGGLVIFSLSEKVALVSRVISFKASVLLLGASWKNAMNYTKQAETCVKVLPPFCSVMVVKNKNCIFAKRGSLGKGEGEGEGEEERKKIVYLKNKKGRKGFLWNESMPLLEFGSVLGDNNESSICLRNQPSVSKPQDRLVPNQNLFPHSTPLSLSELPTLPFQTNSQISLPNQTLSLQDNFPYPKPFPHSEPTPFPSPNLTSFTFQTSLDHFHNDHRHEPHNIESLQSSNPHNAHTITSSESAFSPKLPARLDPFHDQEFEYHQIAKATDNFSKVNILGDGGCGEVYLGEFANGEKIAVKKLKLGFIENGDMDFAHRLKQILTEIYVIRKIHHRNLLELKGWHLSQENCLLIFSYLSNGSLEKKLQDTFSAPLSWNERIKIAFNAAEGIKYLHEFCKPPIIHCDIKSANILLDENLEAQVADFGLARLLPEGVHHTQGFAVSSIVGTNGYLSPDYVRTGVVDDKVDVFSYGVVLFEILSAKSPYDEQRRPRYLFDWGRQKAMDDKFDEIADCRLNGHYNKIQLREMVKIATLCTSDNPVDRPTMNEIVRWLEHICGGCMRRKQDRIYAP